MSRRKKMLLHEPSANCFIFSMIGSMFSSGMNYNAQLATNRSNESMNDKNLQFQREQFDYQKTLNELQMEREDTAFQRQALDAQSVGINPMALAGGNGAPSSALSSTSFSGSSIPSQAPKMDIDLSSFDNLPNLLMNVDQWKNQRDALRSQMANDEVNRAIQLYKAGLKYDNNGKIVPFESSSPSYRSESASASAQERKNNYYGTLPDNLPNYPSLLTYFSHVANDRSEMEKFIDAVKNVQGAINEFKDENPSMQNADVGKMGETLLNMWQNSSAGKDAIEKANKRHADKLAKQFNKKSVKKRTLKNQANYYNRMIRDLYEKGNSN